MDNSRARRKDIIKRTLVYLLMTVAVIVIAGICLFLVLGYSIDQKTGSPEQGGLVQFRSAPDNADVTLDGQIQSFKTQNKATVTAGNHSVSIGKQKYRSWSKSFSLGRGELLWLNALLIPSSLTTTEAVRFDGLYQMIASPDKKWIAVLEKANEPLIKIIDLRDEKKPKTTTLKIPTELTKGLAASDSFSISEWDFGSRYLLVKRASPQASEWLRLDRSDETNAQNLSSQLKLNFNELHFSGSGGDSFYGLDGGNLRKLQLGQPIVPESLISDGVSQFSLYGDNKVALIRQTNGQQQAAVYRGGDKSPAVLESETSAQIPLRVAITSFFGADYAAIARGREVKILKQPFAAKPGLVARIALATPAQWLYFSGSGQFLVAQTGTQVTSYNLERSQESRFVIPGNGPYTRPDHLAWLDDFRLWSDMGGTLRVFDFDGTNAEVINQVTPGQDITLSDNGKRLFSAGLNPTTKQSALQSSVMVLE